MRFPRSVARSISVALLAFLPSISSAGLLDALPLDPLLIGTSSEPDLYADDGEASTDARVIPTDGVTTFETTIRFENRNRRVLYVRPIANSTTRAPAIVMLHYSGGTPEKMVNLTAVGRLVRDYGVWVILPEGLNRKWSTDPVRDRNRTNDSQFIANVIDNSVAGYPIDSRRVYLTGFSLGGFMAERFACEHSERIAAAAWASATLLNTLRDNCALSNTTPVMTFHGTRDTRVDYNGSLGLASAPETAAYFAGRDGCLAPVGSDLANTASDNTSVHLDSYSACSSAKPVRFYTITGGGHTWPGNDYQAGVTGRTTQDIDATLLIWDFFRGFSR